MRFYHVIGGDSEYRGFAMLDDNSVNILMSAYTIFHRPYILKRADRFRDKAKSLMLDSGMISALKKGDTDWHAQQDAVIHIAKALRADRIVHLDVPSEPFLLANIGLTVEQAREITIQNACSFADTEMDAEKVFVIQGWGMDDYQECIHQFQKMGLFDLDEEQTLFGIGSVCVRRPPELFEIVDFCRKRIPKKFRVHCFGIACPSWIREIFNMGVDACDSSTAVINGGSFGKFLDTQGRLFQIGGDKTNKYMVSARQIWNMFAMEKAIEGQELFLWDEGGIDGMP